MHKFSLIVPLLFLALSGCLAKTALNVVTAPVRIASGAVDLATTSQSEADEKRGREIRRREQRLGELEREQRRLTRQCAEGDRSACRKADTVSAEIDALLPSLPYEPKRD